MSSKRDRRREAGASWLSDSDEQSGLSLEEANNAIYELDGIGSKRISVKSIDIHNITPNATQPRRAVPSAVRDAADTGDPAGVIATWIDLSMLDEALVQRLLEGDDVEAFPDEFDALTTALLKVVDVAASINRDGLTNPITLIKRGPQYEIETGERRWLAYHLLHLAGPDIEAWQQIPARIMDDFSVWRQATENSARDDLNAIAKARQLALLMMDLYVQENRSEFQPLHAFEHEQDFYLQGDQNTPYGKSNLLLSAMGVTHKSAITRYRSLLRLPAEIWTLGDDLDWNLTDLYNMTQVTRDQALKMACDLAAAQGVKVAWCNHSDEKVATSTRKPSLIRQFTDKQIPSLERTIRKMKGKDRQKAIGYLRELLDKLEGND